MLPDKCSLWFTREIAIATASRLKVAAGTLSVWVVCCTSFSGDRNGNNCASVGVCLDRKAWSDQTWLCVCVPRVGWRRPPYPHGLRRQLPGARPFSGLCCKVSTCPATKRVQQHLLVWWAVVCVTHTHKHIGKTHGIMELFCYRLHIRGFCAGACEGLFLVPVFVPFGTLIGGVLCCRIYPLKVTGTLERYREDLHDPCL